MSARVLHATVRQSDGEWDIECRFDNGEKYAPIRVDLNHDDLAHRIADMLNRSVDPTCERCAQGCCAVHVVLPAEVR